MAHPIKTAGPLAAVASIVSASVLALASCSAPLRSRPGPPGGSPDRTIRCRLRRHRRRRPPDGREAAGDLGPAGRHGEHPGQLRHHRCHQAGAVSADGYTLVLSGDAAIVVAVNMYKSLAYDPVKDLAPIIQIGRTSNILVVNRELGPASLADLVAQAKEKPRTITFNSTGLGTSQHMGFEQLKKLAAIEILHVPSRGPTMPDILGGHVTASFANILVALPQVKDGKLRALAVSGAKRAPAAPDVPTVAEQGYPGFDATAWFGILAPAGTPIRSFGK